MSEQTPPGFDPGTNPKAAAKAAKAYAKASRPWYKKKRWILALAILVIVIISVATSSGGDGDDSTLKASDNTSSNNSGSKSDSGSKDSKATVGTKKNPAKRGVSVENKSAKYTIDKVEVRDSLGEFADAPGGKYVVITLTAENVKKSTIQISSEDFKLEVGGTEIDASDNAYVLDDAFSYDDLSPGLKRTGKIVFDVPAKNAGKGVLKAQALFSTDEPIYLSLT